MSTTTTTAKPQQVNTVYGTVNDANGTPLTNLKVEIYDIDMRDWQLLAKGSTNKEGKYELQWTHDQLSGQGKKEADIAVKVYAQGDRIELFKSSIDEVRFNASPREEINISILTAIRPAWIEYDYLLDKVTFLAGRDPRVGATGKQGTQGYYLPLRGN